MSAFCCWHGVSVASASTVLRALVDLSLVRSLRQAMATADAAQAATRFTARPEARVETRPQAEPPARIEPRPVIHPTPHFAPRPQVHPAPAESSDTSRPAPETHKAISPIQPPWKKLPWQQPPAVHARERVKIVFRPPDVPVKGRILDTII